MSFAGNNRFMKIMSFLLLSLISFIAPAQDNEWAAYPKWFSGRPDAIEGFSFSDPAPVKTIDLSTGVKLEYKEQGPSNGIPVLLIHGFTDSWYSYEEVMKFLPSSFHVFAVTQRGHGNSDHPATGYFPKNFAEDIAAFLDAMNLQKVFIVGHSMGATITQQFVVKYPGRVSGFVLEGAFASFADKKDMIDFKQVVETLRDPIDTAFVRDFQVSTVAKPIRESFMDSLVNESLKLQSHVWKGAWEGFMGGGDFRKELKKVKIPALIIWGEKDIYSTLADQQFFVSAMKARLVVYKDAGHSIHWEEPKRFAEDVVKFIESVK